MTRIGKNQTFSRECNVELVLDMIKKNPCSATEIADELSLSNATVSSILKELSELEVIRVNEVTSISGLGRKRVMYEINANYGVILCVNISNFHSSSLLVNMKQEVIGGSDISIEQYNISGFYKLVLEAEKVLRTYNSNNSPLRCIVITLPGRVNSITGELILSRQFDKDLFSEKNFIQNSFRKQFNNVPIILANDINACTEGEAANGELKGVENGVFINIDLGIGGGMVINGKPYIGDLGFAGEFGLLKHYDGKDYYAIDEFVSLRVLCEKASKLLNKQVDRDQLIGLFNSNSEIKKLVLESASILGSAISQLSIILDISTFIIGGRAINFGNEYLEEIIKKTADLPNKPIIKYTKMGKQNEVYGASSIALKYIFTQIKNKNI